MERVESWGRIRAEGAVRRLWWRDDPLPVDVAGTMLPFGRGRSYGDCCLDQGGTLLLTRGLSRLISFDPATGLLACEAGVTLGEILARFAPLGFFPPVVPGTKHVTVGGAIANDIHGKNHHRAGSFGAHVTRLELLRSDGSRRVCSPAEHPELFAATVGGLGLTGLVTWAELRLERVPSAWIRSQTVPFPSVDAFFELAARSDETHAYTAAWIDCLARGPALGRGLLYRGNHAEAPFRAGPPRRSISVPFDLPDLALNRLSVAAFNTLYRWTHRGAGEKLVHYDRFFFPLDGVERWNRVYGRSGLLQFQCVLPFDRGLAGVRGVLDAIARSGQGSCLAVLKTFGDRPSPGLLSFPRPGVTIALDFPRRGARTFALSRELERLVLDQGGAMYPAKDLVMSPQMFRASYPRAPELARLRDPRFESTLWRRVMPVEEPT